MGERCETCKFWLRMRTGEDGPNDGDPLENTDEPWGYCRRFPPQLVGKDPWSGDSVHQLPVVAEEWCGEWRANENAPLG